KTFSDELFLFFADANGRYVGDKKAGDFLTTDVFDYDYEPGFGEAVVQSPPSAPAPPVQGSVSSNVGSVAVPRAAVERHLAETQPRMGAVTVARPDGLSTLREFDVLVNAPPGITQVAADSPFYAGTISFFGPMMPGMRMSHDATFAVPLPKQLQA